MNGHDEDAALSQIAGAIAEPARTKMLCALMDGHARTSTEMAAIAEVRHHLVQRFEKGFLLRGVAIEIVLDAHGFSGEGDISLFGAMLNRFFGLCAVFALACIRVHAGHVCPAQR